MSTELVIALAVIVAVVIVVAILLTRAVNKAEIVDDSTETTETSSEHTITLDEPPAVVQASEPISVAVDTASTTETTEVEQEAEGAPVVEETPAPAEEAVQSEPSPIQQELESIVAQITTEEPKTAEPVKTKKSTTKKTTKKATKKTEKKTEKKPAKKDASLANFIDTISKSSEKKTRGRKKKTDDVKIIVTAPLGKVKASKKKKKA
jgi:type IV secretory pathway VirB10-like protein